MKRTSKILFFSMGNAARSRMAEALFRRIAGNGIVGASTAVVPADGDPLATEVMEEIGIDISGQHAEPVAESLKEHFACVVTLSDDTKERSPVWPFTLNLFHWNVIDPSTASGSIEQRKEAFRQVRDQIQNNVNEFAGSIGPMHLTST